MNGLYESSMKEVQGIVLFNPTPLPLCPKEDRKLLSFWHQYVIPDTHDPVCCDTDSVLLEFS